MPCKYAVSTSVLLLGRLALVSAQGGQEGSPTASAGVAYEVDPVHSALIFRIKHLNVAYFYGRFNEIEGTFVLDDADPARCEFDLRVKVASIDTNNADRDKHLKSADFFDFEHHPLITFKSRSVKKTGDNTLEVTGELTLRGVTKPLTVKVERTGCGPGMRGEQRCGWETTFEIRRSDFGMTALLGPVGDEVRLLVGIEGVRRSTGGGSPAH